MKYDCISCFKQNLDKDTIALNKKLLGKNIKEFYCIDCLANYLGCAAEDLIEKIEEFKEEGCELFN